MSRVDGSAGDAPVGRRRELDDLRRAYWDSLDGEIRVVFVGGEPGIGKSHLLDSFARDVPVLGGVVLRGSCYEDAAALPFGPFAGALRMLARREDLRLEGQLTAALGWIVPEWSREVEDVAPPGLRPEEGGNRGALFEAVVRLLSSVAQESPLVLLLDDLHWADEPTTQLLRYIVRAMRGSRVLIVGAYRDTDLDPALPFEAALRDLHRERLASRFTLRRLSSDDTRAIMEELLEGPADAVSQRAVQSVHQASEGVPFFVEELVLHLREEGRLSVGDSGHWDLQLGNETFVPPGVRSVVGHRLSRLSESAREALAVASVIGREFSFELLYHVLNERDPQAASQLVESIDDAVQKRLILETAPGAGRETSYSFAHEQIREVLYWGLNAIRRRTLHETVGRKLELEDAARRGNAARLAYHFSNGDDLSKAAAYSRTAGDEAAQAHAYEEALRHYDAVLEILQLGVVPLDGNEAIQTLLARDAVLARSGNTRLRGQGIQQLLEAAAATESDALMFEAEVRAARFWTGVADLATAQLHATRAHNLAGGLADPERVTSNWLLAQTHVGRQAGEPSHLDRPADELALAARHLSVARAIAERLADAVGVAWITQELGVVLWALTAEDDIEARARARTFLVEALEGFRAAGDRKGEVTALIALAYRRPVAASPSSGPAHGSYVAFLEEIRRLRKTEHLLARESDRARLEALSLLSIHLFCRTEGWFEIALDRATQALQWAESARDPRIGILARLGLSETETFLGRGSRALEYAEQVAALLDAQALPDGGAESHRGALLSALARAQLLLGNDPAAIELAERALALAHSGGRNAALAESEAQLAEILASGVGRDTQAARHARSALERSARLPGNITWDVRAYLVLARLALKAGDTSEALSHATAASSRLQAREITRVWLRTSTWFVHGLALAATGQMDDARDLIKRALDLVQQVAERMESATLRNAFLTSAPWAVEVRDEAQRMGLLPEGAVAYDRSSIPGGLTSREVEVLCLVAAGKTNREISDGLFISEKTVARHLTNIYTKIGSQSRTQAAGWAFRQGIA